MKQLFVSLRAICEALFSVSEHHAYARAGVLEEQLSRDPALALAPSSISPLKRFEMEDIAVRTLLYGNIERL